MSVYHFVSHTHWDREWYLGFEQFRMKMVLMIDELLDLLERDPSFASFTLDGQTVLLEDYLEVRPAAEPRIRSLVREGRLSIGPWYVLPDEFLVSGEALIRNLMSGIGVARRFGPHLAVGYVPDSFGHIAMLPALLRGFGMSAAVLYRGVGGRADESTSEYRWTAPDGSAVLMIHLHKDGYSAGYFHDYGSDEEILDRFHKLQENVDNRALTRHRLIMNGGDHHFADTKLPEVLSRLGSLTRHRFVHGDLAAYVRIVERALRHRTVPALEGELRSGYNYAYVINNGVYSSRMYLKQANARCQNLLERYLEPVHAIAVTNGMTPMTGQIDHLWKLLLRNHPHDSICGCSIDAVHREMMTRFASVESGAKELLDRCWEHLIRRVEGAYGSTRSIAVFNPTPRPRSSLCEADIHFFRRDVIVGLSSGTEPNPDVPEVRHFTIVDKSGTSVPFQVVGRNREHAIRCFDHGYPRQYIADVVTVLVRAENVPPLGWNGYAIEPSPEPATHAPMVTVNDDAIENAHLRVAVTENGAIRLTDKKSGRTFEQLHVFEDGGDAGDEYTYSYPLHDRVVTTGDARPSISIPERGPLRASIRIRYRMRIPNAMAGDRKRRSARQTTLKIETVVSLSADSRIVEFRTTVQNNARDHRLRAVFHTGMRTRESIADAAFCLVKREHTAVDPDDWIYEHPPTVAPMQRFVAVRDSAHAFVLMSEGLPEYDLAPDRSGTLALTLLRCVGTLAGDDLITRPGGKAGWHNETPEAQCLGTHRFHYGIAVFTAAEFRAQAEVNRAAEQFHAPLYPVRREGHSPLAEGPAFLAYSSDRVTHSILKVGAGDGSIVARFWNPTRKEIAVGVDCPSSLATPRMTNLDETEHGISVRSGVVASPPLGIMTIAFPILKSRARNRKGRHGARD